MSIELIHDFAPTEKNPRNSEGCFYRRSDGKILFFYSRYTGGYEDHSSSDIALSVFSENGKRLLSDDRIVFPVTDFGENAGNLMCPSVVTLSNGRLAIFFLVRWKNHSLNLYMASSSDEGETFSDGHFCLPENRYFVIEMERVIRLPSGRILVPAGEHRLTGDPKKPISRNSNPVFFRSDDEGKTFIEGPTCKSGDPDDRHGFQEPGAVLLPDGRLFAFGRTDRGCQWTAFSSDNGETFSEFEPNENFPAPVSPLTVKQLEDGRYIAVFNPIPEGVSGWERMWARSPLVYRTSRDGIHWGPMTELEPKTHDASFCYTSVFSADGFVLLAYCAGTREDKQCLNRLRVIRIPLDEIV